MDDIDSADADADEKPNGRLCKLNNVISNNKKRRIINNNELEGDDDDEKEPINERREENGKVQSAVCDIVNNSKKDICQNNDDKTGITEEYLAVDRILSEEHVKSPELSNSSRGIRRKKHHHSKPQKTCLHVQFHQEEAAAPGAGSATSSSSSTGSSESSSDEESSLEQFSETRAPDGGWGWVVVFASFFVNLIADGITFSFGVIFVEFLHYFGEAKSKTAWIGSLFMAMPLLSGPVASFLTDRFGCRRVSIFGAILAAIGFIISSFTDSIEVLFLTFGVFAGFGLSLCYVAAVVIVAYYFDKKRSFATGLSVCGSGIGTFVFAPLTQFLLAEYGWRGTTLILSGLFLNMCVCGALMRDLPWTAKRFKAKIIENRQKRTRKRSQNRSGSSIKSLRTATSSADSVSQLQPSADELRKILTSGQIPEYLLPKSTGGGGGLTVPGKNDPKSTSLVNIPTFVRSGERVPLEVLELLSKHKNVYRCLVQNYPSLLISSRSCSDSGLLAEQATLASVKSAPSQHTGHHQLPPSPLAATSTPTEAQGPPTDLRWVKRSDSTQRRFPTAYLKDLRVHRHSLTYRGAMLNINRYRLRASSCPDIYRNSMTTIAKEKHDWYSGLLEFWDLLMDMLDLSHFLDIRFLLFAISNFLLYTWYDVPYVYLADNAINMGFTETDASYLISVIGILNMVGEVVLGWAGDRACVNANLVYAACMFLCGAVTAMVPLLTSYMALCAVSGAFGLFIAANYSLTSIILVELITIERFTNAYGLLLLVQGIANLIGPPLAGWIFDMTNSYDLSFYLAGAFISISGVMLLILPSIDKLRNYKKEKLRLTQFWETCPPRKTTNAV